MTPILEFISNYCILITVFTVTFLIFYWKPVLAIIYSVLRIFTDRIVITSNDNNESKYIGPSIMLALRGLLSGQNISHNLAKPVPREKEKEIEEAMAKQHGFVTTELFNIKDKEDRLSLNLVRKEKEKRFEAIEENMNVDGIWFKSVALQSKNHPLLTPDIDTSDEKLINDYVRANYFFHYDIPVDMDRISSIRSYDALHQEFIHDLFRYVDGNTYYVLSKIQECISRNIKVFYTTIYTILFAFLAITLFHGPPESFDATAYVTNQLNLGSIAPEYAASANKITFTILIFLICWLLIFSVHKLFYKEAQNRNSKNFNEVSDKCLQRISNNYKNLDKRLNRAAALGEIMSGDEKRKKEIDLASVLVVNMQWTIFRMFFMETYLGNIMYKILKHSSYYLLFIPVIMIVAILFSLFGFDAQLNYTYFIELFVIGILAIVLFSAGMKKMREAVDKQVASWITEKFYSQFHTMNSIECTSTIIQLWGENIKKLFAMPR